MKYNFFFFLFFTFLVSSSQTINLNESYLTDYLRTSQLLGDFKSDVSFTLKPFDIGKNGLKIENEVFNIEHQMRIAQMVVTRYERIQFKLVEQLTDSKRGSGGFGSTGTK